MPSHLSHIPNITLEYTLVAAKALQDLAKVTQIPFVGSVCSLAQAVVSLVQNSKMQKEQCLQMVEDIHCVLCALTGLCIDSDIIIPPEVLEHVPQYAHTLQTFHECLKAQEELGRFKRMFKQSAITQQLNVCKRDLSDASIFFKMKQEAEFVGTLVNLDIEISERHQELLEMISAQSDSAETRSSVWQSSFNSSSGSFWLLPGSPKIFHGRDSELSEIVAALTKDEARVAILGPGGMGKTTLAAAALHHPAILDKYSIQHFLSCESAMTSFELVALLGSHLGFESSGTLFQIIIQHFRQCGPCLLVLDNVETPWEPLQSREKVEDFLSALADVRSLALVITMRGAERPGKVKWSRPFLSPLEPLPISASRQIFFEVADEPVTGEEAALDELLGLSGSLPLAVSLMANVVSFEGYSRTLSRWQQENTALLSDGYDKNSNLEKSIILSLSGPRMASQNAQDLLSLLSLLPDGITMHDINASKVPISQISHSASSLIRTSLAYMDTGGRLKSLVPIREYIRRVHPPSLALSRPLRTYLEHFLLLWTRHRQLASGNLVHTLRASLGNIHELILQGLSEDRPCWLDITNSIIRLDTFTKIMLKGPSPLMNKVADLAETAGIPPLNWRYRCQQLSSASASADLECWINDGVEYYSTVHCPIEEVQKFYTSASEYYHLRRNFQKAHQFIDIAMCLGKGTKNIDWILTAMRLRTSTAYSMRDACEMIRLVKEARSLAQFNAGPWYELEWLHMEASANWMLGNLPRSQNLIARCQEQVHLMGIEDSQRFLSILDVQADICLAKTEYFEAKRICELAIAKTSSTRSPQYHAHFHVQNAYIGILTGSHEHEILSNLAAAEAVYTGRRRMLCVWAKGELDLSHKLNENASIAFKECLSKTLGFYADVPVLCLATLGDPRHKMERPWNILRWAMIYLALVRKMKDLVATFHALRRLADLFVVFNDEETALNLFNTALEGATNIDIHRLRAECMAGIGDIMSSRGNMGEAKQMWEASIPLFVRSSQLKDAAAVEARLVKFVAPDRLCHLVIVTHSRTNIEATTENLELVSLLSSAQNSSSVEVPAERGSGVP